MLGSLVFAVRKEKTTERKKLDAGKVGIGSLERNKMILGSLVLAVQKGKLDARKLSIISLERKN
jgi:hypothetical protein